MKTIDVTPRMIGRKIRVTADDLHIEGQLIDLDVRTETITEGNPTRAAIFGDTIAAYVTGIILNISGHELRLHGHEDVTILEVDPI